LDTVEIGKMTEGEDAPQSNAEETTLPQENIGDNGVTDAKVEENGRASQTKSDGKLSFT
jgi:hypothetical protein